MSDQGPQPVTPAQRSLRASDAARNTAAAASLGAGIIHFAYAPTHLDESTSHGAFFLTAGWLQLALGVGLALHARPRRHWLTATALVNTAVVAVWVVSRTTGVPGSNREAVGVADVVATVLEVVAVLAVLAVRLDLAGDRRIVRQVGLRLASVGLAVCVASVSVAVTQSMAGHDHHDDASGRDHGNAEGTAAAASDHSGASGHGDASGDDHGDANWSETRLEALQGYLPDEQVAAVEQIEYDFIADKIRERSELLRDLPEAEREERIASFVDWAVENALTIDPDEVGQVGMHTHEPEAWQPITDRAEQRELQDQLGVASRVIDQLATVADAEAAGYVQVSPYLPGLGAHWLNNALLDATFDPANPEMVLYNGHDQTSELVGLSYTTLDDEPPAAFVGENDTWHNHPTQCIVGGFIVGNEGTPQDLCESIGGTITAALSDMWMLHLWQVPGWESPWGLFSAENPTVNAATSDILPSATS